MKNIKKEVHCLLVGAEIFFLLVILSFHHEECSIVSLQIQKARYCKNFIQQAAVIRKKSTEKFIHALKESCYSVNSTEIKQDFFCLQHELDASMFFHARIQKKRYLEHCGRC